MGKIIKFQRKVNNVCIEQRKDNGFVNATAMAKAHGKKLDSWFRTKDTLELFEVLAQDLKINYSDLSNSEASRLSASKYAQIFVGLIIVRGGSPENGGGVWIHPDLAVDLAGWCNKTFKLQVSRWVQEWFVTGKNPVGEVGIDQHLEEWERKHDIRLRLKDYLRVELMDVTVSWCKKNNTGARPVCIKVHDLMNERVQGHKAKSLKSLGSLPLGDLMRDYFSAEALLVYSSINQLATNYINDQGMHPVDAVNESCDRFLGKEYKPKIFRFQENIYAQGRRLKKAKKNQEIQQGKQLKLNLFGDNQAV